MRSLQRVGLRSFFLAQLALGLTIMPTSVAHAITINMVYSDEGDPVPHDENPTWDPAGVILKANFQAAKTIWESLLPGPGTYEFDFHWDDDLSDGLLGLTTIIPGVDTYIEMNTNKTWFADLTPNDDNEFNFTQTLYTGLTSANQTEWFPGTAPPASLEVGYVGAGGSSPGASGVAANVGTDLLTVILHEMGHVMGFNGTEPGDYNIYAQHVGGLSNVLVKEATDDTIIFESHLAGSGSAPWLMDGGQAPRERVLPSATDVLTLAADQGITGGVTGVHLARVGRISPGDWSNTFAWIGGEVPDATQDVYVLQGGAVLLDVDANVRNLRISAGSSVDAQTLDLTSVGDIKFDGGALAVGIGGSISANRIFGDPASLTTTGFSLVRFNQLIGGTPSATSVAFNGSVAIGLGALSDGTVTFSQGALANWNIAQNLTVGDQRHVALAILNGTWNVGGNLTIRGFKSLAESYVTTVTVASNGLPDVSSLNVTGVVDIRSNGKLEYEDNEFASDTAYEIRGGVTSIVILPPLPPFLDHTTGGLLTFDDTATAGRALPGSATINVEGGTGDSAPGGMVTFKGNSRALNAQFWTKPGIGGVSLRISNPVVIAGTGGRVQFEDNSFASTAHFRNDGVNHHGPHGSGGATYFLENSYASDAVFDNYGSPMTGYIGSVPAPGGRTEFFNDSSAWTAEFNNHPGLGMGSLGAGITIFHGNSTANNGVFNNKGGVPGMPYGGATEFYDQASAEGAIFINEVANGVARNPLTAGNVRFYGTSTAASATFHNKRGGGSTFFYNSSTAGDGHFFIEDTGGGFEGYVGFYGSSKGGTADFTIEPLCFSCGVLFRETSNAEQAQITTEDNSQAGVQFWNGASMGQANIDIGYQSGLDVRDQATAANATIRLRPGSSGQFIGALATAGNANITLDGGTVSGGGGGSLFFQGGNAGNSTIYVKGGAVAGGYGGALQFYQGNAGSATIIAESGVAGAGGGRVTFLAGSNASNARFTIGAGGYLDLHSNGIAEIGSLECAAPVYLGSYEARIGGLNTSTTISGPIIGPFNDTGAKIIKIGTGSITLTGANTYIGLTKVDNGTLVINGSTPGSVEVNNGATLKGIGTIGGTVTVNNGTLAPGNTAGGAPIMITIGGLAMMPGGILDFELGPSTYDRIVSSGNLALAGTLNVSFVDGFTPAAGNTFNILDWGSVTGAFNTLNLAPLTGGLSWNTSQLYSTGVLSVASIALPGDFNNNGTVDASDYVILRKGLGTIYTLNDYNLWRSHFGQTAGSGPSVSGVPEPATALLVAFVLVPALIRRRRFNRLG